MSNRKVFLMISAIIFLVSTFIISFNLGMSKFSKGDNYNAGNVNQAGTDKLTSALNTDQVISPNAKIQLKVQYTKSGDIENKTVNISDFAGKSKVELESDKYIVESFSASEVVLIKKVDSYAPNKYVLGVKDECLAIYKTDDEGNLYIEDESTDITDIEPPTKEDFNQLVKGNKVYQFNNKEDAEAMLGEFSS
jgi:hypothetical protein